jgi:hypothetical protein
LVTKPKNEGGLGVLDLKTQNEALLLKNLHKFFNKEDVPWVKLVWEKHYTNGRLPNHTKKGSFWWRGVLKLINNFKGLASVNVGDGSSCLLWDDCWVGQPLKLTFPELHSFAKKKDICLAKAIATLTTFQMFHLPLSVQAFDQLLLFEQNLASLNQSQGPDNWTYIWGNSRFLSSKAYRHLIGRSFTHPIFKKLWKSSCQPNRKVFFWLLLQDRVSTRNLLRRRSMVLPSYNCVACLDGVEETAVHLFLECSFARSCWSLLGVTIISSPDTFQRLGSIREQLNVPFDLEIIILMSWCIWLIRNDEIFRNFPVDCLRCLQLFKSFFSQLLWKAKKKYFPQIEQWLELVV